MMLYGSAEDVADKHFANGDIGHNTCRAISWIGENADAVCFDHISDGGRSM